MRPCRFVEGSIQPVSGTVRFSPLLTIVPYESTSVPTVSNTMALIAPGWDLLLRPHPLVPVRQAKRQTSSWRFSGMSVC
jgi:hypothetical protein